MQGRKTQKIPFQRHAFPEQPHNQWPYVRHDKAKPALANSAPHGEEPVRRCEFCGTSKTPQWREGPNGKCDWPFTVQDPVGQLEAVMTSYSGLQDPRRFAMHAELKGDAKRSKNKKPGLLKASMVLLLL